MKASRVLYSWSTVCLRLSVLSLTLICTCVSDVYIHHAAIKMANVNPYKFPYGKKRLEPAGIMIFASVMSMASMQILSLASQRIIDGVNGHVPTTDMSLFAILSMVAVILVKLSLFVYCRNVPDNASVTALSQDHMNDVATNAVSLIAAVIATSVPSLWWLDSAGAIGLSILILITWLRTGKEQLQMMVGRSAPSDVLSRITYVAASHNDRVVRVDTVLAFHFGGCTM